jgi:hypothetical protein
MKCIPELLFIEAPKRSSIPAREFSSFNLYQVKIGERIFVT